MDEEDNSDLILESVLNTHNQQLQTLRQRRSSLLSLIKINILFLSILVGFAGVTIQSNISVELNTFILPVLLISLAILYGSISFHRFRERWGYMLDGESVSEANNDPRDMTLKEIINKNAKSSDLNKKELERLQNSILHILLILVLTGVYFAFMFVLLS